VIKGKKIVGLQVFFLLHTAARRYELKTRAVQVTEDFWVPSVTRLTTNVYCSLFLLILSLLSVAESASELYRPSDSRLSAKLVPTFEDRGCQVASVTDPSCRILRFLDRSRYFSESLVAPGIEFGPLDP
jgi:hypothetical protein